MHLEVLYSGDHNLSCFYMAEVVKVVASSFPADLRWDIVYVFKKEGGKRLYDLSVSMYGEENVKKQRLLAPVPSIFIDGSLAFDRIPMVEELEQTVREMLPPKGSLEA